MKIQWDVIDIGGDDIDAQITIHEPEDSELLKRLYSEWLSLNKSLKSISTRGINIPDTITENAFCLFFPNNVRIVRLKKGKCSYDCINTVTGKTVQVKAASVYPDLTSFGPRSEYDELYFLDFSEEDGSFKVYDIPVDVIKKTMVNKKQTFIDQQKEGKRPRFSIVSSIIEPMKLKPLKVCQL